MKSFKEFITEEEIIIPKVHMWGALLRGDYEQARAALFSPYATKEHIDWAIGHKDPDVVVTALQSPHATEEQIIDVMNERSGTWLAAEARFVLYNRNNDESQP
jgi:hypothetical protein